MSYICLFAGKDAAVAASDSRLTQTNKFIPVTIHTDHRKKVWKSSNGHMIWALCGITKNGIRDYAKNVSAFLADDDISPDERIKQFKEKAPALTEKFKKRFKCDAVIDLLYAFKDASGTVISGRIIVQNGYVARHEVHEGPYVLEAGANAAALSDIKGYFPKETYRLRKLCLMAGKRVSESVNYDKKMKLLDKKYKATVGGRVQLAVLN